MRAKEANGMPTKVAIAFVAAVAMLLVLRDVGDSAPAQQATSPVQQGLHRFDSVLQEGLSQDTHDAIHDSLSNSISESAEFLSAVETSVSGASQ